MINKIKELLVKYKEIIMYLIFGVLTTLVNWIATWVCQNVFGMKETELQITIANGIAWFLAVLFAFITNRKYVFESKSNNFLLEMAKFYAARVFTGLFEIFLPTALISLGNNAGAFSFLSAEYLGMKGFVSKVLTSIIVIVLNYVLSKLLVFRKKKNTDNTDTKE